MDEVLILELLGLKDVQMMCYGVFFDIGLMQLHATSSGPVRCRDDTDHLML
jgi:hypothetical protein